MYKLLQIEPRRAIDILSDSEVGTNSSLAVLAILSAVVFHKSKVE